MKKFFLCMMGIFLVGIVFAEETGSLWDTAQNYLEPGQTKTIVQDLHSDNMNDIQSVRSLFCNDNKTTRDVELTMRPWQRKEICMILLNSSNTPIPILFWFTEAILDKDWVPNCQGENTWNMFDKSIKNNILSWITIPASWTIIQRFTYVADKLSSGDIYGCFWFSINKKETLKDGNMFLIIPRKVSYIKVKIRWDVYNFGWLDDMKDVYNINKNSIFTVIAIVLGILIIITIFQKDSKKDKHRKNK